MIDNMKLSLILTPAIFVFFMAILAMSSGQAIMTYGLKYLICIFLIGAFGVAWCITIYIKEVRVAR
jgi:hypothetical protein